MTYLENEAYQAPRLKVIETIYEALSTANAADDFYGNATSLLEEIERLAIGFVGGEHPRILFCNPDIEPDFLEDGALPAGRAE